MLSAALLEDGIGLTFADGFRGVVPFVDLPEVGGCSGISGLELPNPYGWFSSQLWASGSSFLGTSPVTTATGPTSRPLRR